MSFRDRNFNLQYCVPSECMALGSMSGPWTTYPSLLHALCLVISWSHARPWDARYLGCRIAGFPPRSSIELSLIFFTVEELGYQRQPCQDTCLEPNNMGTTLSLFSVSECLSCLARPFASRVTHVKHWNIVKGLELKNHTRP